MPSFTATFHGATRKNNSRNGNPTFELNTSEGRHYTETDGSIGYEITNHTGRPEHSRDSWIGKRVRFTTTSKGRITAWELAD